MNYFSWQLLLEPCYGELVQNNSQRRSKHNIIEKDPNLQEATVRPSSSERKTEKSSAKGAQKPVGEIKDILELVTEFKEMVTQMAFEKFDFHQWFRCDSIQNKRGFPV